MQVGGTSEIITNGSNGLLFDSTENLSKCLIGLLSSDDLRTQVARCAQATVATKFSMDNYSLGVIKTYEEVLG